MYVTSTKRETKFSEFRTDYFKFLDAQSFRTTVSFVEKVGRFASCFDTIYVLSLLYNGAATNQ